MRCIVGCVAASIALAAGLLGVVGAPWSGGDGPAVAGAATTAQSIGMKVLVITDDSTDTATATTPCTAAATLCDAGIAYGDWANTLQREGVPYTTVVTNSAAPGSVALPALSSTGADGTQIANYQGVVVAESGTVGLSTAQWDQLQTFEHQFSVRQVTAYAVPSSDYGLTAPSAGSGDLALGSALTLTSAGSQVFPYLKGAAVDPTASTFAYEATPLAGANVDSLITGPNSSTLLGIYTSADGRQTMFQTFNENQSYLQSDLLRHGELEWLTRGTYFGDQRNYIEMDIDDTFTPDDVWDTATHPIDYSDADAGRMQPADVTTATTWEYDNDFRMDQLFNMGGTDDYQADNGGSDPLLAAFKASCSSDCGPNNAQAGKPYADSFGWISHTYDTPYMDVGCATQNYIEAELNENTSKANTELGLTEVTEPSATDLSDPLIEATDPSVSLGTEDGAVFVPGNHSGFADLDPGNPATVDPPDLDSATAVADASSTLAAGTYEYAVTDQFTNAAASGQSAAYLTAPITVAAGDEVELQWESICHAADYVIYRGYEAPGATSYTWTLLPPATGSAYGAVSTPFSATLPDNSSGDPTSTTDVTGGGELEQTYDDAGVAGAAATEPSTSAEDATELPWEQNPYFDPALAAVGITAVGDDGSKPYPDPADSQFGIGVNYTGATYPAGATFVEPGTNAQVVPRHPINIYYNAPTDGEELDEYQTLYDGTSVCADTTCTWSDVINQIESQMFAYMMANDPRPSYVHQTNLMGTPPAGSEGANGFPPSASYTPPLTTCTAGAPCTKGDGTLYQVLDPLLYEYNAYFNSTAPFEQLTEQQIADLLAAQSAWAGNTAVSGSIEGNQVTVDNAGSATRVPLTGITSVGSSYAGSQSGWADAPSGASSYTALSTWPAEPTGPAILTPPGGPAPGSPPAVKANPTKLPPTHKTTPIYYRAVQVGPKKVTIKKGKVVVSLQCRASRGKTAKNKVCAGKLSMKIDKKTVTVKFRVKSPKTDRVTIKLPKKVVTAAFAALGRRHGAHTLAGKLTIVTTESHAKSQTTKGTLTVRG
jgi:hypothetical protein